MLSSYYLPRCVAAFVSAVVVVFCVVIAVVAIEGCPSSPPSSSTLFSVPPSSTARDAVVIVGAMRTASACVPRLLQAFTPSATAMDVFCVFSVDDISAPVDFDFSRYCDVLRLYNYTYGTIGADVRAQLAGFPYDRTNTEDKFPTVYNFANQLRLWKLAWTLIEERELNIGQLYRSITRFRPDSFLSQSFKIDRDAWSLQSNWASPRAAYSKGQPLTRPYLLARKEELDFIVVPSTDQWVFPWTDQVAFGRRSVMRWYLTTLNTVDNAVNITGFSLKVPEGVLGASLIWNSVHNSTSRKLLVYSPKDFVTCICRKLPCCGDCVAGRRKYNNEPWNNAKLFVRRRLCGETFGALLLGEFVT